MKIHKKVQLFAGGLLVFGMATGALAQDTVQTPTDAAKANAVEAPGSAEDVPPPEPIPTPAPERPTYPAPNTYVSEDSLVRAYDFGISMLPGASGGVAVRGVIVGSAAERAGVRPLDTIVAINGQPVASPEEVAQTNVQSVTIDRRGVQQTLRVDPVAASAQSAGPASPVTRGYSYAVPRTTYSAPPTYTYRTPNYAYPTSPYGAGYGGYYGYDSYRYSRPSVRIGIGIGTGGYGGYGYPGYYGPGYGYGRGYYGYGGVGYPGFYGGRSGVGIRIGGFGISF